VNAPDGVKVTTHAPQEPRNVLSDKPWPLTISKIDVGPDHAFTFYVINCSSDFADIIFPKFVKSEAIGDGKLHSIPMTQLNSSQRLSPFDCYSRLHPVSSP
jgi:hypothetical protein